MSRKKTLLPTSHRWIEECLRQLQIKPQKKLGQNFLLDNSLQQKLVEQAQLMPQDVVLEIGPGLGHLTQFLLGKVKTLWAVEIDRRLVDFLSQRFSCLPLKVVHADILSRHRINPIVLETLQTSARESPFKIVCNLPFSVATPVIMNFLEDFPPDLMVVTVQQEVARRLIAPPGSRDYGYLSVYVALCASVEVITHIPAHAFYPSPKIEAMMVKIIPKPLPTNILNKEFLMEVVKTGFLLRRKTLFNALRLGRNLKEAMIKEAMEKCGLGLDRRAETIPLEEFIMLANALEGMKGRIQ